MTDRFAHLHVASGYSLRHGASSPAALVDRAASLGQDVLALTDRDALHGAVRFVLACRDAGIAPVLGVDLAVHPVLAPVGSRVRRTSAGRAGSGPTLAERTAGHGPVRRTPAHGGSSVDPRHPRVVLLARGGTAGQSWAALCRLVSAAHLGTTGAAGTGTAAAGSRRMPVTSYDTIAAVAAAHPGALVLLLGPDSEVGRAVAARRPDLALAALAPWRDAFGPHLAIEVVSHLARDPGLAASDVSGAVQRGSALSSAYAARLLGLAREHRLRAVLTNAVRHAAAEQAPMVDVLDAIRRLVPLEARHLDRANGEGHLKSGPAMAEVAAEVVHLGGGGPREVDRLLADTRTLAEACRLDAVADLGIGEVHVPELDILLPAHLTVGRRAGGDEAVAAQRILQQRCDGATTSYLDRSGHSRHSVEQRLAEELATIATLGFAGYFLTVAEVVDLVRSMHVRIAARGSGAGSLVNHLLGISGVDPLAHGLLMERFLSPLRRALPDIDVDVESARREEVYGQMLERFGGERCTCVSMMDTYRVRHAVRDVGAALGMPPGEVDAFAKAFPHIRARDARNALQELPELRSSGFGRLAARGELDGFLSLVEAMDGLPRHVALHPCGVLLSDGTLLDRTPVEASFAGFPMSQFDKDDVEEMGFLKLDVLGIRMQSSMAHAVQEIRRVDGTDVELDALPLDDEATYQLIRSTHTLGCFQIESPGQRELVGKFAPETFDDLITDISLFRPGPVKSDMVTPFLRARQGWNTAVYLHDDLRPVLEQTVGVVVFHEQVLGIVSVMTGCSLAEADEVRRSLGSPDTQLDVRAWFYPAARDKGYDLVTIEKVWEVLKAFASFGFCKAHAAAFAVPTYHSAWLKAHHPAAFLAGVLTHDPGMYPKRLILDEARNLGIAILGLDVNVSEEVYRVEPMAPTDEPPPQILGERPRRPSEVPGLPDGSAYGIRLSLADVKGINAAELARIVAGRPYGSLSDFWHRAGISRPVAERLVVAGAFDSLYDIGRATPVRRRGQLTRRDLLLQVADLDRSARSSGRRGTDVRRRTSTAATSSGDVVAAARSRAQTSAPVRDATEVAVQLTLGLDEGSAAVPASGLPEMTDAERVRAELEVLGLDASRHVVSFYDPMLAALGVVRSRDLLTRRNQAEVLVAGVKVATQTPPVRSGRRVVFLTLDDATGPVDATFFEDVQGQYAATVFGSWLLLVRGVLRRTGPRGISLRATGAWELGAVLETWRDGGLPAVADLLGADSGARFTAAGPGSRAGAAASRSSRPVVVAARAGAGGWSEGRAGAGDSSGEGSTAGGMGQRGSAAAAQERARRVLVHASGFRQSPYADIKPQGTDAADTRVQARDHGRPGLPDQGNQEPGAAPDPEARDDAPNDARNEPARRPPGKLWHSSPGSSGW
jgi:error-prone DNA polymerase